MFFCELSSCCHNIDRFITYLGCSFGNTIEDPPAHSWSVRNWFSGKDQLGGMAHMIMARIELVHPQNRLIIGWTREILRLSYSELLSCAAAASEESGFLSVEREREKNKEKRKEVEEVRRDADSELNLQDDASSGGRSIIQVQ